MDQKQKDSLDILIEKCGRYMNKLIVKGCIQLIINFKTKIFVLV